MNRMISSNRCWKKTTTTKVMEIKNCRKRWFTSMQSGACCFGLKKNVPSTSGYRSNTNIESSHRTHVTRLLWCCASEERINKRVSSFPWFPSSSICQLILHQFNSNAFTVFEFKLIFSQLFAIMRNVELNKITINNKM